MPAVAHVQMAPPTSGLAIASLICGIVAIVSCTFVTGIPAVICGHMALTQIRNSPMPMGGQGMAMAGLVTGYLALLAIAGGILFFTIAIATSTA